MKKIFSLAAVLAIAISASAATKGNEPAASKYPSWPVIEGKFPGEPKYPKFPSWPSEPVTSWPVG